MTAKSFKKIKYNDDINVKKFMEKVDLQLPSKKKKIIELISIIDWVRREFHVYTVYINLKK